jgi:hypothetical protein
MAEASDEYHGSKWAVVPMIVVVLPNYQITSRVITATKVLNTVYEQS